MVTVVERLNCGPSPFFSLSSEEAWQVSRERFSLRCCLVRCISAHIKRLLHLSGLKNKNNSLLFPRDHLPKFLAWSSRLLGVWRKVRERGRAGGCGGRRRKGGEGREKGTSFALSPLPTSSLFFFVTKISLSAWNRLNVWSLTKLIVVFNSFFRCFIDRSFRF